MDIGCSICQETFIASAQCDITNCGHLFHRLCIAGWLQYSKTCPTCRNATTKAKLKRVYFTNQMSDQTVRVDELLKDLVGAGEREVRLRAEILSLTAALAQANQRIATLECTNGPVARNEVNPSVQNRSHGDYLYSGPFAPHLVSISQLQCWSFYNDNSLNFRNIQTTHLKPPILKWVAKAVTTLCHLVDL